MPIQPELPGRTHESRSLGLTLTRFGRTLGLTAGSLVLAVFLAELYRGIQGLGFPGWKGPFIIHVGISLIVLLHFSHQRTLRLNLAPLGISAVAPVWLQQRRWLAYGPACLLMCGSSLLGLISQLLAPQVGGSMISTPWAWIFLIPVAEEIFFRGCIGSQYRRVLPGFAGVWLSAATFSLAHGNLTIEHLLHGRVGLPLGPFLLGLLCETLYLLTGSLLPGMVLHAAANGTVAIFELIDDRWLNWLKIFYL